MSESKQTRVIAVVDDMFFASKIKEAFKSTAVELDIAMDSTSLFEMLNAGDITLIIIDLNSKRFNPIELIIELKSSKKIKNIPILGYLPHVEEGLKTNALDAGCDIVMPRSRFSREISQILREYN